MTAWKCSNFGGIPPLTTELAVLRVLKTTFKLFSTLAPSFLLDLLHLGQLHSLR